MKVRYRDEIVPALMKEFGYSNVMQVPRIAKIAVNIGLGEAIAEQQGVGSGGRRYGDRDGAESRHHQGQAARSLTYKLREGMPIGVKTTLRGERMWDFLDRLINIVLPRQRDFQGVSTDAFDGRGNYSLGLREQLVFPEINYDKVDKIRGLEITIVTTAKSDEEARRMLALMSMPFKR